MNNKVNFNKLNINNELIPNENQLLRFCDNCIGNINLFECVFYKQKDVKKKNNNNNVKSNIKKKECRRMERFSMNNKRYHPKFLVLAWYYNYENRLMASKLNCKFNTNCINPHHIYINNKDFIEAKQSTIKKLNIEKSSTKVIIDNIPYEEIKKESEQIKNQLLEAESYEKLKIEQNFNKKTNSNKIKLLTIEDFK